MMFKNAFASSQTITQFCKTPNKGRGGSKISQGEYQLPEGCANLFFANFCQNCMKMKEFGPKGGVRP